MGRRLTEHPGDWLHVVPAVKAVDGVREKAELSEATEEAHSEQHACLRVRFPLESRVVLSRLLKVGSALVQSGFQMLQVAGCFNLGAVGRNCFFCFCSELVR